MDYTELQGIVTPGDIIQLATPYIIGIGQLKELLPHTMVVEPYIKHGYEEDALPATVIVTLADVHMLFLLKPDYKDDANNTKDQISKSSTKRDAPRESVQG